MWNIKVEVKKEHIENSLERDSNHCMIADAIHDRLKWATFVQVDTQSIRFNNKKLGKRYIFLTPPDAQKAIILFDQGIKVKPFSFKLLQGYVKEKVMRARQKKAKKTSRSYKHNPNKKTPPTYREFGLRRLSR